MTTPNPARVVFEEMNRDPGKFYPMETCAPAVQVITSLVIISVDMPSRVTHIDGMETGETKMTDLIAHLSNIQCGCERRAALSDMRVDRDTLVRLLQSYGFGRSAVPTDWATYYDTDELAGFVLDYADRERPEA